MSVVWTAKKDTCHPSAAPWPPLMAVRIQFDAGRGAVFSKCILTLPFNWCVYLTTLWSFPSCTTSRFIHCLFMWFPSCFLPSYIFQNPPFDKIKCIFLTLHHTNRVLLWTPVPALPVLSFLVLSVSQIFLPCYFTFVRHFRWKRPPTD